MLPIISLLILFGASLFILKRYLRWAEGVGVWDQPNHRSSHRQPVIRGGGLVFPVLIAPLAVSLALLMKITMWWQLSALLLGGVAIAWVGWQDDRGQTSTRKRFLIHLIVSIVTVSVLGGLGSITLGKLAINWGLLGSVLAVVALVWSINLFNFMDGVDGIAGVEAICVIGTGGVLFYFSGGEFWAWFCWGICTSVLAFLWFNWAPARLFMGDVGSGFLGFTIATLAILGQTHYEISVFLWIILYVLFWGDATLTLLRRLIRGETIYQAHRSHAYQRLHLVGWSHQRISLAVLCLNLLFVVFSLIGYFYPISLGILLLVTVFVLLGIYYLVERRVPMRMA
ncbi:MAG TPA: glycosyl transferase [Gammaproteobacteria bacterium]|nr:glycosyl transferase [Gammaproteobacteria bacterium]